MFAFGGEVSPIVVEMLFVVTVTAGGTWGGRGWVVAATLCVGVLLAHLIKPYMRPAGRPAPEYLLFNPAAGSIHTCRRNNGHWMWGIDAQARDMCREWAVLIHTPLPSVVRPRTG